MSQEQTEVLLPNTQIVGRLATYNIDYVVGQGEHGITYCAFAEGHGLNGRVAIKELFPREFCYRELAANNWRVSVKRDTENQMVQDMIENFIADSRKLESLDHPGIPRVFETIVSNGTAYMVMEFIEGRTLEDLVEECRQTKNGVMGAHHAENFIRQIAETVDYLHDHSVVHLDIRPANIILTETMEPVLTDFSMSFDKVVIRREPGPRCEPPPSPYKPLELWMGVGRIWPESDIYGLAATFYTLLTGQCPPVAYELELYGVELSFPKDIEPDFKYAIQLGMQSSLRKRLKTVAEFAYILDYGVDNLPEHIKQRLGLSPSTPESETAQHSPAQPSQKEMFAEPFTTQPSQNAPQINETETHPKLKRVFANVILLIVCVFVIHRLFMTINLDETQFNREHFLSVYRMQIFLTIAFLATVVGMFMHKFLFKKIALYISIPAFLIAVLNMLF